MKRKGQACGPNQPYARDHQPPNIPPTTPPSFTSPTTRFYNPFEQNVEADEGRPDDKLAVEERGANPTMEFGPDLKNDNAVSTPDQHSSQTTPLSRRRSKIK